MKNLKIKYKLYLLIIVLLFPMILLQSFQVYKLYTYSIESQIEANNDFAEAVNTSFTNYLEKIWDNELSLGLAFCFNKVSSSKDMNLYMQNMRDSQTSVLDYGWVDPQDLKIRFSSSPSSIGQSVSEREYIQRIINGEEKVVSSLIIPHGLDSYSFVVARAINQNGTLKGIIIAAININSLATAFPENRSSNSSSFGIVDKDGNIVYRNGLPDIASKRINLLSESTFKTALTSKEPVKAKKSISPITGKEVISTNHPISEIEWAAYAFTSYDEIVFNVISNIKDTMITFVLTTLIFLFLSFKIIKQILYPINILKESSIKISSGNFKVRTNISGNDELAKTSQAFDKMIDYIEEYDRLKFDFFSNLSHELKTPLNIILSSTQLLGSLQDKKEFSSNEEKNKKYFKLIRQNCYRLLRLINNLIDVSKVDSGFMKFNYGYYNIVSLIEDITISVAQFAENKGIEVIFDTDIEEKPVLCDPDKIERIILNLLSNSIKFTPKGGSIFINIFDKGDTIRISIKDTGVGIAEDKLKVIFDKFRQVDSSLQRKYEGSGIGLSLVKSLVEAHYGNITVSSIPGEGSNFTIELLTSNASLYSESNISSLDGHTFDTVQRINIEFSDIYSEQ
ncbi:MAG: ATP-binding protein [Clostridiaceae bacterium]